MGKEVDEREITVNYRDDKLWLDERIDRNKLIIGSGYVFFEGLHSGIEYIIPLGIIRNVKTESVKED